MSATTTSDAKPLPQPDPVTVPYWESVRRHAMRLQRCRVCRRFVFYPRPLCPFCFDGPLEWVPVSGRGVIYAFTVVHRAPGPEFQPDLPYTVALVDLDEGARMMTTIVSRPADGAASTTAPVTMGTSASAAVPITIGTAVEVVYEDVTPEVTLPRFRPLPAGGPAGGH